MKSFYMTESGNVEVMDTTKKLKTVKASSSLKTVESGTNLLVNTSKSKHVPCTWTNPDVQAIKSFVCHIPFEITDIMTAIQMEYPKTEFSILGICKYNKSLKEYELQKDFYIPKQEVSASLVDYLETDFDKKYNCVIHKHPDGCNSFSSTDETYINQNFDFSLLWVNKKFHTGIMNYKAKDLDVRIRLLLEPLQEIFIPEILDVDLVKEKIKEKVYKAKPYTQKSPTQYSSYKAKKSNESTKKWGKNQFGVYCDAYETLEAWNEFEDTEIEKDLQMQISHLGTDKTFQDHIDLMDVMETILGRQFSETTDILEYDDRTEQMYINGKTLQCLDAELITTLEMAKLGILTIKNETALKQHVDTIRKEDFLLSEDDIDAEYEFVDAVELELGRSFNAANDILEYIEETDEVMVNEKVVELVPSERLSALRLHNLGLVTIANIDKMQFTTIIKKPFTDEIKPENVAMKI